MAIRLVVSDLDNTLYDWVTFFARSFSAMVDELVLILGVSREMILDEFRELHQRYHTSEPPFGVLELPSVVGAVPPGAPLGARRRLVERALQAFSDERRRSLRAYEGVEETLEELVARGVRVVGHTEAVVENAYFRLKRLRLDRHLSRLYALRLDLPVHPVAGRPAALAAPSGFVVSVPYSERKPNPELLRDICRREGVGVSEVAYVGDSVSRDVRMAKDAGVFALWAQYGVRYERSCWDILVRVSHWTADDIAREEELRTRAAEYAPDHVLRGFGDILSILWEIGL